MAVAIWLVVLITTIMAASNTPSTIYGVNLGGWLLLEPWITPSLFDQFPYSAGVKDEWTFCQYLGKDECKAQLETHWDSFFSKDDLEDLANGGINTLRIPVGYWILGDIQDDEPWVTGQMFYLERLLGWAQELGLVAIIDLHAGPGSQNGFDNSGKKGYVKWDDPTQVEGEWRFLNVERTLDVIEAFADAFTGNGSQVNGAVIGIGVLNEPRWDIDLAFIKNNFYKKAYPLVRKNDPEIDFHMSDSFRFDSFTSFMQYPKYSDIYLDTHIYHAFDNYLLSLNAAGHKMVVCNVNSPELDDAPLWTVVGEWSLATTDCAKYLNGFNNPSLSRWEGQLSGSPVYGSCTGRNDSSSFSTEYRTHLNQFAQYQMDAYQGSRGWFFWTAKAEQAPQWDYLQGLKEGWIPRVQDRTLFC